MAEINVVIVVDAVAAALHHDLNSNVYLIDSNHYMGSNNEGNEELVTACFDGDVINWRPVPVTPSSNISISSFSGAMVGNKICQPSKLTGGAYQGVWQGAVQSQGTPHDRLQYTCTLDIGGVHYVFDPFLHIQTHS